MRSRKYLDWPKNHREQMEKIKRSHLVIDLSEMTEDQILAELQLGGQFIIGAFLLRCRWVGETRELDVNLWEQTRVCLMGKESTLHIKFRVQEDFRFKNQDWLTYFNMSGQGEKIPEQVVVEIIRWIQGIQKMAYLL